MSNSVVLQKMIRYISRVNEYTNETEFEDFIEDNRLIDACVFNLLQIGELVSKLDIQFMNQHNDIEWNQIRGLRNRIVHDYEGVNLELIWEIIREDIPNLKDKLAKLL